MSIYAKQSTANYGEKNGLSKLTNEKVRAIKRSKGQLTQNELAEIYGVHRSTIARIQAGKIWKHVKV